jgi:hypothetical protein
MRYHDSFNCHLDCVFFILLIAGEPSLLTNVNSELTLTENKLRNYTRRDKKGPNQLKIKSPIQITALVLIGLSACGAPGISVPIPTQIAASTATISTQPEASSTPTEILTFTPTSAPTLDPGEPQPGSVLSSTQHGVTVTVKKIVFSDSETIVDFIVELDPKWGFTFAKYDVPPQQVISSHEPMITDEKGNQYKPRSYQGASVEESQVDPSTGIALTSGRFIFDPVSGSHVTIKIWLEGSIVHAPETIRLIGTKHTPTLPKQLMFGELSAQFKSAVWEQGNALKVTIKGVKQDDLILDGIYLYTDTTNVSKGYEGYGGTYGAPEDRTTQIIFDPSSQAIPAEVHIAGYIGFLTPFQFEWIRPKK